MKFFLLSALIGAAAAEQVTPVSKVVTLLQELEAKITKEGEAEVKAFKEYTKWCEDSVQELGFEIKTATSQKATAAAALEKCTSEQGVAESHIAELAQDLSTCDQNLASATGVRKEEHDTFLASEAELVDAVDTLARATSILSKEMSKNPALLQKQQLGSNMQGLVATLGAVIDAASFSSTDRQKLMALVQSKQTSEDDDEELGAPAAAIYKTHSSNILDVLEDMKDKAEEELANLRKAEMESAHGYDVLKQSLTDENAALTKELGETKAAKAEAGECVAQQTSDLNVATADLKKAEETKASVETDCATTASDHKASMEGRAAETDAIKKALEVLADKTGAAESRVYSFAQTAVSRTVTVLKRSLRAAGQGEEIVNLVSKLANRQHSAALTQLAQRIGSVMKYASSIGEDPFAKVKGLIQDMIERLEAEASAEASHKAYCDEETAKTKAKKEELTSDIDGLTAKIDKATATATKLRSEVAELQKELADLMKLQAEMDTARADEKAAFAEAKVDLETGIAGVQEASRVLKEYYGASEALLQQPEMPEFHKAAAGAGGSIIEILEVIESDFSKNLAAATLAEESAQSMYDKMTQENKITKATKEQDVKYKSQEASGLEKAVAEHSSDREGLQTELSAVLEYSEKLVEECVAKPETYEDRKARRAAEIAGLKEALTYLEAPAALIQQGSRSHSGARRLRANRM
eukprot:CAMPEP_0178402504 /NCGR_PEP_ID=MMETSP0689_2-20121128/16877_1 /TAXON_ID=160604 /ORGANISM="Amphidinium massartii, Strain CS-259" /LENGTH=699 /DNA_ID=CAMNT_0020023409 /DNA_START=30 /DNA_END=2129 /DNA_ORIENTATION=-